MDTDKPTLVTEAMIINPFKNPTALKGVKQFPESFEQKRVNEGKLFNFNSCQNSFPLLFCYCTRDMGSMYISNDFFLKNYTYFNLLIFPSNNCTLDHSFLKTEASTWSLHSPSYPKSNNEAQTTKILSLLILY